MDENSIKGWKAWIIKSYHPIPTVNSTIVLFIFLAFLFILLGIIIEVKNGKIIEVSKQYDNLCPDLNSICNVTIQLTDKMEEPIFLFYELDNFYQNHRRYLRSKSLSQLAGDVIDSSTADKNCDPITRVSDLYRQYSWNTSRLLNPNDVANPCGLMAKSFFNDSYMMFNTSYQVHINENEITWPDDIGKKFKRTANSGDIQWIDPENEHFIVWMRPSGLSNFRKLWGRIETDLLSGNYTISILNLYNASYFAGTKTIVLSTSGTFGGKNQFLGITYIIVGCLCVMVSIIFYVKKKLTKGRFGAYIKED